MESFQLGDVDIELLLYPTLGGLELLHLLLLVHKLLLVVLD